MVWGVEVNININDNSRSCDVHSKEVMNAIWMEITKDIIGSGLFIYCVVIDGVIYYDSYEQELLTRYNEIENVTITAITQERSFYITLQDLREYMDRAMAEMGNYIKPLYSGTIESSKEILPTVVASVEWIGNAVMFLQQLTQQMDADQSIKEFTNNTAEQLQPILKLMTEELEWSNYIGFADIIQYEFLPFIEEFYRKSEEVVENLEGNG